MPITIDEKFDSREATESESPTTELLYVVQGTDDDLVVKSLVDATAPALYNGLVRDSFTIKTLGNGVWECSVQYVEVSSDSQFTFDTGGGTQHISQAIQTINRYPAPGEIAPDFQSAIGVNQDQIEGTDITVPVYNFTETHYIDDTLVTGAYKATLFFLTGLTLGNITGIDKEGWQYLWVRFADEEDNVAKTLIKKPIAAYVERVYEYGDFSGLGIGT